MICLSCHCGNHCADSRSCDCECTAPDAAYQSLLADLEADEPAEVATVWGNLPLGGDGPRWN